jgi:ABC-type nickel/cobalt efflux system permease component RcnA
VRALVFAAQEGLGLGLMLSAFTFGFRHGIDWDHIAAITDITSSSESPRRGVLFGTLYAAGHAVVVLVIGIIAIALAETLPETFDQAMGRVVGVTLILLGIYVFYALIRYGREFRMRSRWMLLFSLVRRAYQWMREWLHRADPEEIEHEHEHISGVHHEHEHESHPVAGNPHPAMVGSHRHSHRHRAPTDPFMNYGRTTSAIVGALHGVGAETPTQVVIFLAAAGAGGVWAGIFVLLVFLVGLLIANTVITLGSAFGFLAATKRFGVYLAVSLITGTVSLVLGVLFVLGRESILPALFAG